MDKNLKAYIKLDKNKLTNQYVVIVDGKTISTGLDIEKMLKAIRKRFPHKIPFVAKIPEPRLLVLTNLK